MPASVSASDLESSADSNFRHFEPHRDPRTHKLGKERERIAFVIGHVIGKDRSIQHITRHGAHLYRGQRISGPQAAIETEPVLFCKVEANGCVTADGDDTPRG